MNLDIPKLRRDLLRWYAGAKRDLPWRRVADPYAILVSELMLQQTQVKTVLPYYEKFLKRFPDARTLAQAPEEEVLAAWAGLGYYRRARFLHAAAKAVSAAGAFPADLEGLRALPGVGAYTAAAVGSIAFGLPEAVVDGNVVRVVARLLALDSDPTRGEGAEAVRRAAQALLDPRRPGDFNQAVMELGASLCAPSKPRCPDCPIRVHCAAFLAGRPEDYPRLPPRPESVPLVKAVLLLVQGRGAHGKVLARVRDGEKRPQSGQARDRLKGFWAFPEFTVFKPDFSAVQPRALKEARRLAGPRTGLVGRLPRVRHRITVYDIQLLPFRFAVPKVAALPPEAERRGWGWVSPGRLASLPLASAEKKLLGLLRGILEPPDEELPLEYGLELKGGV